MKYPFSCAPSDSIAVLPLLFMSNQIPFFALLPRSLSDSFLPQVKSRPPTFAFFCNTKEIPGFFERFLRSRIQKDFKLDGVPIRMLIRKSKVYLLCINACD